MNIPDHLKYLKSHEWIRLEGDGTATVGITDHAQKELTDVVFVEPPKVGQSLAAGRECAVVESVKAASDIYAPASGDVVAVNEELASNPALVNTSPYDKGWFFKLKLSNPAEVEKLLSAADYRKTLEGHS